MAMVSMNTSKPKFSLEAALFNINTVFRGRIIKQFFALKTALAAGNDKTVGIEAGHLCETVLRMLQHEVLGSYTKFGSKIGDFGNECRKIVSSSNGSANESLRLVIPRALVFVYTMRNKRGIGHVGGDVDANRIDALSIAQTCDWIVCELIRCFHGLSLEEAQDLVDGLAIRRVPEIWEVAGKKRVLKAGLPFKDQVLLLCYQDPNSAILSEDLFDWIEYSNFSVFKKKVLTPLHKERFIEYDKGSECVMISPLGAKDVENRILYV
jgi:hypothetical protein